MGTRESRQRRLGGQLAGLFWLQLQFALLRRQLLPYIGYVIWWLWLGSKWFWSFELSPAYFCRNVVGDVIEYGLYWSFIPITWRYSGVAASRAADYAA